MDNLIGDFEKNFLTDKTQFGKFGDRILKNQSKIEAIYGKDMAAEMNEFGRIMKLLGESTSGGDLVAANIAASPLENLGTIAKLSLVGQLFSSKRFYKSFNKKYSKLSKGENIKTKGQIAGELIKDSFSSLIAQGSFQSFDETARSAVSQAREAITELDNSQELKKPLVRSQGIDIPRVSPVQEFEQTSFPQAQNNNIRERARQSPAAAATLLGGLGNADLL
jgi:hypothetical protein